MTKTDETKDGREISENERAQKIQSLRDMIMSAEKTIQGAKSMLLQLEGKKKTGRKRKVEDVGGKVVEGSFDGQIMIGTDGKQYPVPANYASKSKLVEGDTLKLTITDEGSFIYKQIGPAERRQALGIAGQDENGNYYIIADGKPYKVLLASITYFKVEPGDEVAIVMPRDIDSDWAAVENVIQKAKDATRKKKVASLDEVDSVIDSLKGEKAEDQDTLQARLEDKDTSDSASGMEIIDEWTPDIRAIEREIKSNNPSL